MLNYRITSIIKNRSACGWLFLPRTPALLVEVHSSMLATAAPAVSPLSRFRKAGLAVTAVSRMRKPASFRNSMSRKEARNRIHVSVRCRPMNEKEVEENFSAIWECGDTVVTEACPDGHQPMEDRNWTYDAVFGADAHNSEVYEKIARPIVESTMDGYNGLVVPVEWYHKLVDGIPTRAWCCIHMNGLLVAQPKQLV